MSTPRLYTQVSLVTGTKQAIEGQVAHHVLHVLRLKAGATVTVFDGHGREHLATLESSDRSAMTVRIGEPVEPVAEPSIEITLIQGIARKDRMDLILQKSVELGVGTIQPVWMQRSQSPVEGNRLSRREKHWQGIIISACEQSGRARLPQLLPAISYGEIHNGPDTPGLRLMLQPDGEKTLSGLAPPGKACTLMVGPEGGMTNAEMTQASEAGFTGVRMGQRVLRTETAGLATISAIQTLWGDFV